jgi:hypothetical protein
VRRGRQGLQYQLACDLKNEGSSLELRKGEGRGDG